jgi:hypothetical protein
MKFIARTIAAVSMAAFLPVVLPAPAFAESRTTRPVTVTVTVPVMLQLTPSPAQIPELPEQASPTAQERRTIALSGTLEAVTNHGASVTQEWRRSENGRGVKLYTAVIL